MSRVYGVVRSFAAAIVVAVALPAAAQIPQSSVSDPPVIITQAEATLRRSPDRAWLTLSTEVRDGKAANARRKSAEAMTAVQESLKATGLPPDAIRTIGFSMQPEMDFGPGRPGVRNYVVRNQIEVRIEALDLLADVIDAANSPKNVAITISNPRFELKNREASELEAIRAAVKTATTRAQAMADGAGQALGPIVRIQQGAVQVIAPSPGPTTRSPVAGRAGGGATFDAASAGPAGVETPITPTDLEIRVQVTVTTSLRSKDEDTEKS